MFLFKIGLSRLISNLSLISSTSFLVPFAKNGKTPQKTGHYCNLKGGHELHSPLMI